MLLWASRLSLVLGWLLIALGLGYGGLMLYLTWHEGVSPSTDRVLVLNDGRRVPLRQPTPGDCGMQNADCGLPPTAVSTPGLQVTVTPDASLSDTVESRPIIPSSAGAAQPEDKSAIRNPQSAIVLPPQRLLIPAIGVDWPVVLSDNTHMPRFKGIGWLFGSAYPGQAGNLVLFGHLDGPYATLGRLHELRPGDTFTVATTDGAFTYQVRTTFETTPDDVSVLIPTDTATATLITCAGQWDKVARTYDRRLIVTADLVTP